MAALWLTVHYNGNAYDIEVKDRDEYSYLCLLQDLEDCGYKQNVIPAKHPVVKYYPPNVRSMVEVNGDVTLQKMLQIFKCKKEVDIYVEHSEQPSSGVKMFLNLKAMREQHSKEREERRRAEKGKNKESDVGENVQPLAKVVPMYTVNGDSISGVEYCEIDLVTGRPMEHGFTNFESSFDTDAGPKNGANGTPHTPIKKAKPNPRKKLAPKRKPTTRNSSHTPIETPFSEIVQEPNTPTHIEPFPHVFTQPTQPSPTHPSQNTTTAESSHQTQTTQPSQTYRSQQTETTQPSQPPQTSEPSKKRKRTSGGYNRRLPRTTAKRLGLFKPQARAANEISASRNVDVTDVDVNVNAENVNVNGLHTGEQESGTAKKNEGLYEAENEGPRVTVEDEIVEGEKENYMNRVYKNGQIYQQMPWGEIDLMVWDIFFDKEHCLEAIRDYSVQQGADLIRERVDSRRYTARCANEDCSWRIHASVLPDKVSWAVKTLTGPHDCERQQHNPMANIKWCANKMLEDVRANSEVPVDTLIKLCLERYGVSVPTSTMYKAKTEAVNQIQGNHGESYNKLPQYIAVIKQTDPGAFAYISWLNQGPESPLIFKRMFISFEAQYKGFAKGCRLVIGIDGCHLKDTFNGCLLSAVALDGNQQIFPIAYAVVAEESKDSWTYFFRCLRSALKDLCMSELIFMSDRMRGVEGCLAEEFPTASRRICCRHLFKNFSAKFPGPYFEEYFWQAADAFNEFVWLKAMEKMKALDAAAYQYLMDVKLELWCRFKFDPKVCCPDNTNNFTESWNATLGLDRVRPILSLLEGIRRSCMVRIGTRQTTCESWLPNDITPHAKEEIRKASEDSRFCQIHISGRGVFEVIEGKTQFPIDLNILWCKCGKWQITGIPCKHAMRVINNSRLNPHMYVSDYYSVVKYKETYNLSIPPMPDHSQWEAANNPVIKPPEVKRTVGRPPRNRRRQVGEERKGKRSVTVRCSKCGEAGHNKLSCMGGLTASQKKAAGVKNQKKRGREEGISTQGDADLVTAKKKKCKKAKTTTK